MSDFNPDDPIRALEELSEKLQILVKNIEPILKEMALLRRLAEVVRHGRPQDVAQTLNALDEFMLSQPGLVENHGEFYSVRGSSSSCDVSTGPEKSRDEALPGTAKDELSKKFDQHWTRCGNNGDWSVEAWWVTGPGVATHAFRPDEANYVSGHVYIIDDEESDNWLVVRRYYVGDGFHAGDETGLNDYIEELIISDDVDEVIDFARSASPAVVDGVVVNGVLYGCIVEKKFKPLKYTAHVPSVTGCFAEAWNLYQLRYNVREAIEAFLNGKARR